MATKTGEISPAAQNRALVEQFHAFMLSQAQDNDMSDRGEEIMDEQAAAILNAEGTESILRADMGGTVQCRDVPGTFWRIYGYSVMRGNRDDIENSHGYYVQFNATCIGGDENVMRKNALEIGKSYPLQTGALLLTTKARALAADDAYPIDLALVGNKTGSGNMVLRWGPMPKTTIHGSAS